MLNLKQNISNDWLTPPLTEPHRDNFHTTTKICLFIIFLSAALVGIVQTNLLAIIILVACIPLVTTRDIYLVYPVMIFYHLQFGELFGLPVYTLFSIIFLLFTILHDKTIRLKKSFVLLFGIFVLYCIIAIMPYNTTRPLLAILDMLCIMTLIMHYLSNSTNLKNFFKVFALIALVAFFTGTQIESNFQVDILIGDQVIESVRNCATFEDPNYMGFFYTLAIFSTVTLKLFNPKIRIPLIIALYVMMLSSLSITALVVNSLLWVLYLFITKKINLKTIIIIGIVLALILGLYSYGKANPDAPIIGMLSHRLSEKLNGVDITNSGDLSNLTTGRSDLAKIHFDYFMNQPIWKMLIGMNAASTLRTDLDGFRSVAHNEYIDWLLNIGIIGAIIMLGFLLKKVYHSYKDYTATQNTEYLCVLFVKFVWIAYAFTLTLYGDFRFLFAFLI